MSPVASLISSFNEVSVGACHDGRVEKIWESYRWPIILGGASFISIAAAMVILIVSARPDEPIEFSSPTGLGVATSSSIPAAMIAVDVAGAVVRPGLYQLPFGSRVADAIATAGGLSREVDTDAIGRSINRAAKLSDGAKLYIPKIGDQEEEVAGVPGGGTVSVNASSQSELEALPGIGPVTAQKIISGRPYMSLEELVGKKSMSQSLFDKLAPQLTL